MDPHLRRVNGKAEASRKEAYGSRPKVKKKYESTANSSKKLLPEIGPTRLLDLPLGVKLPIFPGTRNIYYTTNLCEKLYQPSYGFNLNDPYCRLMDTTYNSLHDPHLKSYYTRKDMLRKLSTDGFITIDGRVTCTLKELNNYRHYLTTLKLDFERNYIREQKMLCKQVHDCYIFENSYTTAKDQQWLFAEKSPVEPAAFSCRYRDMLSTELHKMDVKEEKPGTSYMNNEENEYQENIRNRIDVHTQIEEDWKMKEMLILSKIGEEVQREERIEKQRDKTRAEADRKKQLLLERKIAYHLQKMQRTPSKKEESKTPGTLTIVEGSVHLSESCTKKLEKTSTSFVLPDTPGEKSKIKSSSSDEENTQLPFSSEIRNICEPKSEVTTKQQVSSNSSGNGSKKLSFKPDSADTSQIFQQPLVQHHLFDQKHSQGKNVNRNSLQDNIGHDICKAEFVKDVWDISPSNINDINQELQQWRTNSSSDEEEVVIKEVIEQLPKVWSEHQLNENSLERVATQLMDRSNRKTRWFLKRSGCPTSQKNAVHPERPLVPWKDSEEEWPLRVISAIDFDASSSDLEFFISKTTQQNNFVKADTELNQHWLGHKEVMMSSTKAKDLSSHPRDTHKPPADTITKATDGLEIPDMENSYDTQVVNFSHHENSGPRAAFKK